MSSHYSGYAQSQGIKLLESALLEYGPIFTLEQIKPFAVHQNISTAQLRLLVSSLSASGWIEIIKRGTYMIKSPIYSGEVPPFAIASALVQPLAISHWSALAHHGFTTQIPSMVQASTPRKVVTPDMRAGITHRPRGRAVWRAAGVDVEFVYVQPRHFFGHQQIWAGSWRQVNITDPERTVLDLVAWPDIFGGMQAAIEITEGSISDIDVSKLVRYALQYHVGSVIKRLGWILGQFNASAEIVEPLQRYPVTSYYRFYPNRSSHGKANSRWHIYENLD
jgi:predicted transcriptional regulator of viral defense system